MQHEVVPRTFRGLALMPQDGIAQCIPRFLSGPGLAATERDRAPLPCRWRFGRKASGAVLPLFVRDFLHNTKGHVARAFFLSGEGPAALLPWRVLRRAESHRSGSCAVAKVSACFWLRLSRAPGWQSMLECRGASLDGGAALVAVQSGEQGLAVALAPKDRCARPRYVAQLGAAVRTAH